MGQTNILPDARLPLRLLTPSGPIFHTVNRKYFAKKKKKKKKQSQDGCFKIAAKAASRVL